MPAASADYIAEVYRHRKQNNAHRLSQGARVRDVLANKLDIVFKDIVRPGEEPVVGNLVWAAARTVAQRVGRMPRLDVQPSDRLDERAKAKAEAHEQRLTEYTVRMNLAGTRLQAAYWLIVHDMVPLVVRPSTEYGIPIIEVRDPMTCLPGTVWPHKPDIANVLFVNQVTAWAARALYPNIAKHLTGKDEQVEHVLVGEFFDGDGVTTVLLEPTVVALDFIPSPIPGRPLTVIGRGFSCDMDFHGQFDHVISALIAQAKLFGMVMSYAGQQVAAETVVVGEVSSNQGRWATGPGAVNNIVPMPGASATKLVNNMSPQIFNELDRLERAIRLGGQFPAQLSGEPVASIATGRGLEQLTLTVDDNVAYWQTVLDDAFMRAYGMIPELARKMGAPGAADFDDDMFVYVRSLSGSDPAETVRMLQLQGAKNISRITVMDRLPEVDAPLKELERLDADDMRMALIRNIDNGLAQGQFDGHLIAKMIKERLAGKQIEDVWIEVTKLQMEQQQEQQEQASAAGGQPPGQPPPLDQLLNPSNLVGQSTGQLVRQARTGPMAQQAGQANMLPGPTPGGQMPGPPGIPA